MRYGTEHVTCLGCKKPMRRDRPLAIAQHTRVANTIHVRWVCDTPDCGTELVIEDDFQP